MSTVAIGSIAAAGISAAGSIAGASTQADAAQSAAQLQAQEAQNALNFQEQEFNTQQKNIAPFLKAGTQAEGIISGLTSTPGEGLLTPWTQTFTPPTAAEARATPGYQFQLTEGENDLEKSAAANGGLLSTGTAKGIEQFGQDLADTTYSQSYQRALDAYQLAYNQFQNNQTNTFNRLATQAGVGQTSATTLGQEGQAAANNVGNISLTTGAQQAQQINNAASATASGYAGVSNALIGGIQGYTGGLTLQALLANQYGTNPTSSGGPIGATNGNPYFNESIVPQDQYAAVG